MKILLVHNYYGSSAPSGENKVFEAEKAMLEKHGHEVAVYARHSDEIRCGKAIKRICGKIKGVVNSPLFYRLNYARIALLIIYLIKSYFKCFFI